jgi:cytochrome d ubiquinol oxidase subunit I
MDALLARWQFATTTVYHYLIVPLSIGLTALVAVMQTLAYRNRGTEVGDTWDRAARFYGRIMLVLFALGIVTGIVQEFQFGMNWSAYSRFVGDIFGAPLAMEGLIAFFLESTFLGLWIFGRDLLGPRLHLACIWLAALGSTISAYFILAANSFMQHPVGFRINPVKERAELTSLWKVLTNSTQLVTFPHTIFAAFMTASASSSRLPPTTCAAAKADRPGASQVLRLGIGVLIVSAILTFIVGHWQGQIMTDQQPMKMASAEALCDSRSSAIQPLRSRIRRGCENKVDITIPNGLSFLATNTFDGYVDGVS